MQETDLLLVLGERIGPSMSQGFTFPRAPKPDQAMIHVWPSTEEVGRNFQPELGIGCDPHEFIKAMRAEGGGDLPSGRAAWVQRLNRIHKEVMNWTPVSSNDGVVFGHACDKYY